MHGQGDRYKMRVWGKGGGAVWGEGPSVRDDLTEESLRELDRLLGGLALLALADLLLEVLVEGLDLGLDLVLHLNHGLLPLFLLVLGRRRLLTLLGRVRDRLLGRRDRGRLVEGLLEG